MALFPVDDSRSNDYLTSIELTVDLLIENVRADCAGLKIEEIDSLLTDQLRKQIPDVRFLSLDVRSWARQIYDDHT